MPKYWLSLFSLAVVLISAMTLCFPTKACRATWFKPVDVCALPIVLPERSCMPDTGSYFSPSASAGIAVHFQVEYVAEAAIEPGILGIHDSLVRFSIDRMDTTEQWQDVTGHFYYGLPKGCSGLTERGDFQPCVPMQNIRTYTWCFNAPDASGAPIGIDEFVRFFNQIGRNNGYNKSIFPQTGFQLDHSFFTFWAKPEWLKLFPHLLLQLNIETASGKKMNSRVQLHAQTRLPETGSEPGTN